MNKFDIISFHPGRQHNLEQAQHLAKRFENYKHITSLHFTNKQVRRWKHILPKLSALLQKRSSDLTSEFVDSNPWPEIKLLVRKGLGERLWYDAYLARNLSFQQWIIKNYTAPRICLGFDTCSWQIFQAWKNTSFLILDLSIAIPQYKLTLAKANNLGEEAIAKLTHDDNSVYEIYKQEIELADLILCGSDFVKQSCLSMGIPQDKIVVLPYGIDLGRFVNPQIQYQTEKIKVVFVGAVTVRKGADILLKSWKKIIQKFPFAELHFYGKIEMEIEQLGNVFFHGFVSQQTLIEELKTSHVSVLPSFFEGSSLAIYQSMAMGLAIITTPNSGSIIKDNVNGFLINYGSENELTDKLEALLSNEELRGRLALKAMKDVREYTWSNYGDKLCTILESVLEESVVS
jgi:glycosyltransferase involved in cell wall biosynthesis